LRQMLQNNGSKKDEEKGSGLRGEYSKGSMLNMLRF